MTYKELLQALADQASQQYTAYLQSKIEVVQNPSDALLEAKIEQYHDSYTSNEKKFGAILAMVKNGESLDNTAPEESDDASAK
jgi:hypothetical protein